MTKSLCRGSGLHQWDARVSAVRPGEARRAVNITVFSDSRAEAVRAACEAVEAMGFTYPTVDHVVRIGR